jgi:phage gp45-like
MFLFSENAVVEDISTVPAEFQCFYSEDADGSHKLDTENPIVASAVKAITGLGKSLTASRADVAAAKKRSVDLSPLSEFGDTPDAILTAFNEKLEEAGNGGADEEEWKKKLQAQREQMTAKHAKELSAKDEREASIRDALYNQMVTSAALTALSEHKGSKDLLMPVIGKMVRIVEEDGSYKPVVLSDDGETPRYNATGADMTVSELVAELKTDDRYARAFDSDTKSGTGSTPGTGGAPPRRGTPRDRSDMSASDLIKAGLEKGQLGRVD